MGAAVRVRGAVLLTVVLLGVSVLSGCAASTSAPPAATTPMAATTPPQPIEQVVRFDPLAEPLVAAGRSLVAGTEGFASPEARTALDAAVQLLEASVQVAQLSAAGGPAASEAIPPVDEETIAADIDALYAAIGEVRAGVIDTAARVLNDETPDAPQASRDALFTAIVAQQAAAGTPPTDDTPRQLLALVLQTRAVQEAQVAGAAAAAAEAEAAREAAGMGGGATGGSEAGDSGGTFFPVQIPPREPVRYCSDPINLPDFCVVL